MNHLMSHLGHLMSKFSCELEFHVCVLSQYIPAWTISWNKWKWTSFQLGEGKKGQNSPLEICRMKKLKLTLDLRDIGHLLSRGERERHFTLCQCCQFVSMTKFSDILHYMALEVIKIDLKKKRKEWTFNVWVLNCKNSIWKHQASTFHPSRCTLMFLLYL